MIPKSVEPNAGDMMDKFVSWRPCVGCGKMCQMGQIQREWICWNCGRECVEGETMGDREACDEMG